MEENYTTHLGNCLFTKEKNRKSPPLLFSKSPPLVYKNWSSDHTWSPPDPWIHDYDGVLYPQTFCLNCPSLWKLRLCGFYPSCGTPFPSAFSVGRTLVRRRNHSCPVSCLLCHFSSCLSWPPPPFSSVSFSFSSSFVAPPQSR